MRVRTAYAIYLVMSGSASLFFALVATVNLIYQNESVRLNPLQLVLVGTVLEATCFLAQVPTGALADLYSRRRSIVVGTFLIGAGFVLEGSIPRFGAVLAAQVIWGLGATFTDGADAAWVADEIGEEAAGRAYLRGSQIGAACGLAGIGISVALATVRLNLPIILGGALFMALAVYLWRNMPEQNFTPAPREQRASWRALGHTMAAGARLVRLRPVLITILAITLFQGAFSEGFDRLWQYQLLHHVPFPDLGHLQPVLWFGLIQAGVALLSIGAAEVARRRLDVGSHRAVAGALCAIDGAIALGTIALGLAGSFGLALVTLWTVGVARSITGPLRAAWLNQSLESRTRATLLSFNGQVDALGQIVGGPLLGLIAVAFGSPSALVTAGLFLVPALALYARTLRPGAVPAGAGTMIDDG
jgi:DHA3 family tetracycline resistance protein-like MFS transporter